MARKSGNGFQVSVASDDPAGTEEGRAAGERGDGRILHYSKESLARRFRSAAARLGSRGAIAPATAGN